MIKVTIDGVQLTYPDNAVGYFHTVVADESGDHVLLSKEEWENIEDTLTKQNKLNENLMNRITKLETTLEHLSQQVSNISKSLRYVCLETESPIHFS